MKLWQTAVLLSAAAALCLMVRVVASFQADVAYPQCTRDRLEKMYPSDNIGQWGVCPAAAPEKTNAVIALAFGYHYDRLNVRSRLHFFLPSVLTRRTAGFR